MRKLERIAQLDSEVGQLKEQNMQLVKEGDCLRGELRQLKDILRFAQFCSSAGVVIFVFPAGNM